MDYLLRVDGELAPLLPMLPEPELEDDVAWRARNIPGPQGVAEVPVRVYHEYLLLHLVPR